MSKAVSVMKVDMKYAQCGRVISWLAHWQEPRKPKYEGSHQWTLTVNAYETNFSNYAMLHFVLAHF